MVVGFVCIFSLNSCIFVALGVILNLFYESLWIIVLDFYSVLRISVVIDIYSLDSYLG